MTTVGIHAAKTQLSKLVAELESGGDVVIARHGQPVARLVRYAAGASGHRWFGAMADRSGVSATRAEVQTSDAEVAGMFRA